MNGLPIQVAAYSHRGRRENNEDSVYGSTYRSGPIRALLAVADGMGGHQAGEVASSVAIDTLLASLRRQLKTLNGTVNINSLAQEAVDEIASTVSKKAAEEGRSGMGTTLCFSVITENGYFVGNVGDSRAYLIRGEGIQQISQDHTAYFEMMRSGRVSAAEAAKNPYAHHITRSIGSKASPRVDTFPEEGGLFATEPGDIILLCSDGLVNTVRDHEIVDQIRTTQNLSLACHNLASLAYMKGGTDNISIVAAEIGDYPRMEGQAESLPSIDVLTYAIQGRDLSADRKVKRLKFEIAILVLLLIYVVFLVLTVVLL